MEQLTTATVSFSLQLGSLSIDGMKSSLLVFVRDYLASNTELKAVLERNLGALGQMIGIHKTVLFDSYLDYLASKYASRAYFVRSPQDACRNWIGEFDLGPQLLEPTPRDGKCEVILLNHYGRYFETIVFLAQRLNIAVATRRINNGTAHAELALRTLSEINGTTILDYSSVRHYVSQGNRYVVLFSDDRELRMTGGNQTYYFGVIPVYLDASTDTIARDYDCRVHLLTNPATYSYAINDRHTVNACTSTNPTQDAINQLLASLKENPGEWDRAKYLHRITTAPVGC